MSIAALSKPYQCVFTQQLFHNLNDCYLHEVEFYTVIDGQKYRTDQVYIIYKDIKMGIIVNTVIY